MRRQAGLLAILLVLTLGSGAVAETFEFLPAGE